MLSIRNIIRERFRNSPMIHAVLFDLDDTLYPEWQFYESGFATVATELARRGVGDEALLRKRMEFLHHHQGRGGVFDHLAQEFHFPPEWVPALVRLFHEHRPRVHLPNESVATLKELRPHYRLGIITDGHAAVQRRKIRALDVESLVDAVVVTDDRGRAYWKPHPQPVLDCCALLNVNPRDAVLVGDNPERDVLAAQSAGVAGIRLRQGHFHNCDAPPGLQCFCEIQSLGDLPTVLKNIA